MSVMWNQRKNSLRNRCDTRTESVAILVFAVGSILNLYGLYAFAFIACVLLVQERLEHVGEMMAGCFLYLGTGIALFVAGNFIGSRKRRV